MTRAQTALICGISGQDGAFLARFLLEKGYRVVGSSRDCQISRFYSLERLGIRDQVELISMAPNDFRSVLQGITQVQPDEIYNLAGQTSVGLSFEQPIETLESITTGTINLLEAIRFCKLPARIYNAGSSECFGDTGTRVADETTPFHPRSPYGLAKAAAHWAVANYREAYGIYCCSGILFNHESPLRPARFVTQKIISAARRIREGESERLVLGDISVIRDWGWAPEYVEAMWLMLQQRQPEDFVIATGRSHSLVEFVAEAFTALGLDWQDWVTTDPRLYRPTDLKASYADPNRAAERLGWVAKRQLPDVVKGMIVEDLN